MIESVPRSLYIHVPFCTRRCSYCDFAVEAMRVAPVDSWLDAIRAEVALVAQMEGWPRPIRLETLYIGGGTPSLLGPEAMARLRERLEPWFLLDPEAEWTCEANPESFTPELARSWRSAGVNRISLGAQTFHPEALRWMGRMHGPEGIARAVAAAREAGIENLSLDLIFGLPSRLARDWGADLERALALAPEHISLYGLTAEQGTPLGRWVEGGREQLADEDGYAEEYLLANEMLVGGGFEHYEVSNFARPGRQSRHNRSYWQGVAYAALGPGAHSFAPPRRRWNIRSWDEYRTKLEAGTLPIAEEEEVRGEDADLERIWLALRTRSGHTLRTLSAPQHQLLERWRERGLALDEGGRVRLTPAGWLLLDRLALDLHLAGGGAPRMDRAPIDDGPALVQIAANSNPAGR